ncbi:MAG: hypothetical protein JXR96_11085 [Deltaproteobacteria bacterium]|nr:hypothetical protein [Deltaproteobacteria bacterium]
MWRCWAGIAILLLLGCGDSDSECSVDLDCEGAQVCRDGRCVDPTDPCEGVTDCVDGDGCCPAGCTQANDDDCGDPCAGVTQCIHDDGCCPTGCIFEHDNDCADPCAGVTQCIHGDGCCPTGCIFEHDDDCADPCDGVTACVDGDGCCPTGCTAADDEDCEDPCAGVTACIDGDGCCPQGCTIADDDDCADPCEGVTGCIDGDGCCPGGCSAANDNDCGCSPASMEIIDLGIESGIYDIARDMQDRVHMIWKIGNVLHYGRIENGVIEGHETAWDGSLGGIHTRWTRPRLSVRPDGGAVHTSFIQNGNLNLHHVWRSGGAWQHEEVWGSSGRPYKVAFPVVGPDSDGIVHLVAQEFQEEPFHEAVVYARKANGSWTWTLLEDGGWRQTAMFIDRQGGVHATWKWYTQAGHYRYVPSGGSLNSANSIEIPKAGGQHSMGDSFVEPDGTVHHAFVVFHSAALPDIEYSRKPAGAQAFEAASSPSGGAVEMCTFEHPWPAVAAFEGGRVLVAWGEEPSETEGTMSRLKLAWRDPGESSWHSAVLDSGADIDEDGKPAMTLTGRGLYLVWRSGDGRLKLGRCGE